MGHKNFHECLGKISKKQVGVRKKYLWEYISKIIQESYPFLKLTMS